MTTLEQVLKHLDKLVEHGLLDEIAARLEDDEITDGQMTVLYEHVGEHVYASPDESELEARFADAFLHSVATIRDRLWPLNR